MNYRVLVDMVFEEESHLERTIGTHFVEGNPHRQVDVASTGMQPVSEVVVMSLEGSLPDVLAWMIEEWQDADLAVEAFAQVIADGRAEPM